MQLFDKLTEALGKPYLPMVGMRPSAKESAPAPVADPAPLREPNTEAQAYGRILNGHIRAGFMHAAAIVAGRQEADPYPVVAGKTEPTLVLLAKYRLRKPKKDEAANYIKAVRGVFRQMCERAREPGRGGADEYRAVVKAAEDAAQAGPFRRANTLYFQAVDASRAAADKCQP